MNLFEFYFAGLSWFFGVNKKRGATVALGVVFVLEANASNLFVNPSFEDGRAPWISLAAPDKPFWHDFTIAADPQDAESKCARLELSSAQAPLKTEIWGVVQEITESLPIPRYLRGRYYVGEWQRGTAKQYLQVVFVVWRNQTRAVPPVASDSEGIPIQVAFVLGGINEPPFRISNRKFFFEGPLEPPVGEWREFEFDLQAAFAERLKLLPEKLGGFRVLFEVRFDGRAETDREARATVYFDDLYLGDESKTTSPRSAEGAGAGMR